MNNLLSIYLTDLEELIKACEADYENSKYFSYKLYLDQYNEILTKLHKEGYFTDKELILQVPMKQRSIGVIAGSAKEIEKLKEIILNAKQLYNRLLQVVGPLEEVSVIRTIENIFERFHKIVRQLRKRYNNRTTLEVEDEYDVQDLLHALLQLYFDDIRPEEWTPSYAGGSRRIDFLLKKEKVVLEVKKTRRNLSDKEIGEQLLIDISTYAVHPDCEHLICFVYDPEGRIGNPKGLEFDLNKKSTEDLKVNVYIFPK